jgi:hypothetical protein
MVKIKLSLSSTTKSYPQFPGLVLPYGQKLTLGLLATIALEVVEPTASRTSSSGIKYCLMKKQGCSGAMCGDFNL